jgi:hypothetical protein
MTPERRRQAVLRDAAGRCKRIAQIGETRPSQRLIGTSFCLVRQSTARTRRRRHGQRAVRRSDICNRRPFADITKLQADTIEGPQHGSSHAAKPRRRAKGVAKAATSP